MNKRLVLLNVVLGVIVLLAIVFELDFNTGEAAYLYNSEIELKTVTFNIYGAEYVEKTAVPTVAALLKDHNLTYSPGDSLYTVVQEQRQPIDLATPLYDGIYVEIEHTEQRTETETLTLPYETEYQYDFDNLTLGEAELIPGEEGQKVRTYLSTYVNNKLVDKVLVKEELVQEPQNEIVLIGRKEVYLDIDLSEARELYVEVTAYNDTITATGDVPYKGVIAVDPKVIPLYSKVYVPGYGMAIALDTGGLIKGNIIDLFFESQKDTWRFGRQHKTIYVFDK